MHFSEWTSLLIVLSRGSCLKNWEICSWDSFLTLGHLIVNVMEAQFFALLHSTVFVRLLFNTHTVVLTKDNLSAVFAFTVTVCTGLIRLTYFDFFSTKPFWMNRKSTNQVFSTLNTCGTWYHNNPRLVTMRNPAHIQLIMMGMSQHQVQYPMIV